MIRLLAALPLLLLSACPEGDDDDLTPPEDCADEDVFVSPDPDTGEPGCGEIYCGEPEVAVGTGISGYEALMDGDPVPVWYGSQGGYHIDITTEMNNLCPIVFLRPAIYIDPGDGGELIEIFAQNRHVQALRIEPEISPRQQFWGIRGFIPCVHWPDDPDHPDLECPDGLGSAGAITDFEVVLRMEAWDHNEGPDGSFPHRYGMHERRVQPFCCGE